jgi:hypothetical protein
MGLSEVGEMVELYPPMLANLPMSLYAPPKEENSRTPPSNPGSKSKFWSNLSCIHAVSKVLKPTVRYLSLRASGALIQPAFGAEYAGGAGRPVAELCHRTPSGSMAFSVNHPPGSVGGVTLSKLELKIVTLCPCPPAEQSGNGTVGEGVGVPVGVNVGDGVAVGESVGVFVGVGVVQSMPSVK